MSLKPGKKYLVDGAKEKITKRNQGDFGQVHAYPYNQYYHPRIDYVQDAEEKIIGGELSGYPKSQLTTKGTIGGSRYGHDKIPFFGANRVTYDDVKYNEVHQTISNDEIYQISSDTQIKYDSVTYSHGDIIYANHGTSFETVRGNPLFIPIAPGIGFQPPQNVEPTQDDYYFVYGTSEAAYLNGLKYNGTTYYPGDMLLGLNNVNQYQTHLNNAYVNWPNAGHFTNGVFDGAAVAIQLNVLNNPNLKGYSTLADALGDENNDYDQFLVYGYSNAFYNGYSLRPEILLKNIFKTGSSIDFSWDTKTTGRKYPTIREIVKSDGIQRGIEYYIARDREINTETNESHIKYDESFLTTRSEGISFAGRNNTKNYFVPPKQVDTTNDSKDTEDLTLISPFDSDIERFAGNPFVIRKEPLGLRTGQDYILVSDRVDSIADGKIYFVRGTGSVVYNGVTIENGESFKGTAQPLFSIVGTVNVFPLVNEITLEGGVAANTTISINGGIAVAYTDSLLKTSYGQKGLRFNIASCDSPVMYWEKKTGSHGAPRVYPKVTTFNNDAAVYVHADGQGSVRYPSTNLYYLCEGIGLRPSDYGRKKKLEVEAEDSEVTACTEAGGEWVPQRVGHHLSTRAYYNLDSFNATGGSCSIPLYDRDEAACVANGGDWTFDASADVFDDHLFTYRTHIGTDEQNYPFTVTATSSAHGSDGGPPNQPAATQIEVSALTHPLRPNDCISFGEDLNGNYPLFVVDDYDYVVGNTVIDGRLLYGDIVDGSVGTVSIKPSTNNTNPYEHYYVEDLEVKAAASASVGASSITIDPPVVDIKSGTLLKFTNNGVFVAEFKVDADLSVGDSPTLSGNLRVGDLSTNYVAKLPPKVVGDLSINRQFSKKQRFRGVPNFNVIRAYNYKTLGDSLPHANTQASINAYQNINVYDIFNVKDDLAAGTYKVGGGGYVKYKNKTYHGEGQGRVVVNHESNIDGELDDADSDDLLQKGAYYEGVGSIKVEPLPSIIPEGTEIVFPNGVFRLSKNADAGDTEITGEILADYMENFIYSTIWHKDKSFYYKIEGETITGDGGTYSKVDKGGGEVFDADLFVYNSTAKTWVDGEELNPDSPPYANRKIIKINGSDRKEYYMEVTPTEATKTELEENRTYEVQADGSFVEINRQLTNGEVETGSAFVVGGNVYETKEGRKFNGSSVPTRDGGVPEFIVYNEKPFIPGEVFTAVEGETHWVEATISGTPTEMSNGIWRVPVSSLNAAIPVVPKLRSEEDKDTIWTPEADLNDNKLIPLFGKWDETEKDWYDKEVFEKGNLTSEGAKVYTNLRLRFGNGAVGEVQEPEVSWGLGSAEYDAAKKVYKKTCTEIFLKQISEKSFKNGETGETGSGSDNSGIIFGGYASGDGLYMKVKALPHALEAGTEIVFYPSHPFRQFRALVEEERAQEAQYPSDWWSSEAGARRFTLTQQASAGSTTITGNLKASYNTGTEAFEGVGFKARAEIFREIVYNDKVIMAGGSFTCRKDITGLDEDREETVITTWKDSQNSKLGIKNSTGAEKVVSYDDFIDYYEERPFYSGRSFNFVSEGSAEYKSSGTSNKTTVVSGDITGSQIRFSEDVEGMFFFVPKFGFINKLVGSIKIYKVSKTSEKSYPHLFNNTAVSSYTEPLAGKIKVGGNGSGTAGSTSIGGDFDVTDGEGVAFNPSSPVMYQKIATGFEANKFYLLDTEDLSGNTHDPETLYQKLVYNNKRYYPFLQDTGLDNEGTAQNYTLSIGGNKLHPPYIQSYVFGRSFAPLLENRLTNNKLDRIKLLKLSDSQWSEDTTIINTARYFSLINSSFLYYTILIKKKFNGQWNNWEIAEKQAEASPEKLTPNIAAVQASKIRIYDSTDINSDIEDLRYMVATSSESHYTANYPHLVNVIEEKQPVLINSLEDERLYVVEGGDIHYAMYGGNVAGTDYGLERCDTDYPVSGPYEHHKFFYGKTDAWGPSDFGDKLETTDHVGLAGDDAINFAVSGYGNFDEFLVNPSQADSTVFKVATCFDPWEIQADRVYTVTGHANDRIEYNGGVYKPDDLITGKHLNAPSSVVSEPTIRTVMSSTEYEVRKKSTVQPWMLSNDGAYSKEVGYKKLTPLLYKKIANGSIEANKKYILYKGSDSTAIYNSVTYNVTDRVAAPDNEFRGTVDNSGVIKDWTSSNSPTLMQKFQDGLTIIPGVEYFVYGQGKVTYAQSIVASGSATVGNSVAVSVVTVPTDIEVGQVFTFLSGSTLVVGEWDVAAKTITGELSGANIIAGDASPVVTNHYSSQVITTISEISPLVEANSQHNLGIVALPQDLFRGESLVFSGGGVFILSEGATIGSTNLKGVPFLKHINAGETAKIVDFREVKTKEITASGNLATGGTNTFKGLDGFSRVGGKAGELEILVASAGTAGSGNGKIEAGFLYKVFGQGTVTYNGTSYKGENIIYGVAGEASIVAANGSFSGEIWEIIDPYAVLVGDQVYAYGGTGYLFEYSDDGTTAYITNGSSRTWLDTDSGLKVHKIPYAFHAGGFAPNQPTICSSRIYGIEPGVTYTVDSTDLIDPSSKRRAVIKYVRDGGDCKMRDGTALGTPAGFSSSKYNHRNDCLRRDILTIDFDGPDSDELKQSWEDQKIEYGDYSTQGVDFRITTDELEHYPLVNGERKILSDGDSLTFSKGGRFILSADLKIGPSNSTTERGETRYFGTMYGTIPFGHYLYHHEHAPILSWQENIQDYYYTSDGTEYSGQTSRVYVHNGEIKLGITYRVEEGVEIRYNGAVKTLGQTFDGVNGVTDWEYTSSSNEFEYITSTENNPTETEFVGVAGRPFIEVVEGNPKIFVKGEGILTDGQYVVEGDDDLYYDREYTASNSAILSSYYDTYKCEGWDGTEKGQTSITPVSTKLEDRAYVGGILVAEGSSSFSVSNPKPLKNGAWVYDSENLGPILNVGSDFPLRAVDSVPHYNVATGVAEAQDFIDVDAGGDYAWSLSNATNETNYHLVTEGFLEFAYVKSSTEFPEVGANDLAYKETQESVLFNLSADGDGYDSFLKQGDNFTTGVVFGAGEFSIHNWDEDESVLHETTIYKAYGGFGGSPLVTVNPDAAQGKTVTSIDEGFMYRVKDGSVDLQYKDKLIIINNEAGYSSVDMDGNQVTFEDSTNNQINFNYDSFDNDLYKFIQVKRKGKTEGTFAAGDILVFESLITSLADTTVGAYDTNSANSAGISVSALPVNMQEGEVLFFETSTSVTDVTDGEYYCVTDGTVSYGGENYGPYHFSRVFKATNDGSISGSVVKASVLTLGEIAGEGSGALYGTVSQAGLEANAKCYREVAIKLTAALAPADTGIAGKISDPLSLIDTGNSALKIRSLDNGQVISKGFGSNYSEKGVYSQYSQHERFKGIEDAISWRGSGTVEYTNLIDHSTDFFVTASLENLYGEYTSGQPKILYDLDPNANVFADTGSAFRYYLYDIDYGSTNRGTLAINGKSTKGNNNFFIYDGSTTAVEVNDLKVTANNGAAIKSFVYVYKLVASGDITEGKDYLVYGTGSIVYGGLEINSSLDYTETSFVGGVSPDYDENPYIRKSWNSSSTELLLGTSIPTNEAKFYVARPVVYEKIYAGDGDSFSIPSEAGVVYNVFGEGSVTYGQKEIFATNQYIAVASDMTVASNNKLISSGAISYGGRMIASAGDQYNISENLGIISPISPVRGWTYAAIMQTVGKSEPTLDNAEDKRIYLYRKIHGAETLEENKKYYVFGAFDYIFYKIGSKTYDYYPRGRGREDITVKGSDETDDALTINGTTITVPAAGNNFSTLSEGDEMWVTWTVGGVVYQSPRTVGANPTNTSITIDSTTTATTSTATAGWSGRVDGTTTAKTSVTGIVNSNSSLGRAQRTLVRAGHALVRKGLGCCIRIKRKYDSTTGRSITRHKKYTYGKVFSGGSSVKLPEGYSYIVRGRGEIHYPVFRSASSPGANYSLLDDTATPSIWKHSVYTKTYAAGQVFTAIENPEGISPSSDGADAKYFYKTTGQEKIYRLPDNFKDREEKMNSMDQFIDIAPPKYGVESGQLLDRHVYKVFYVDPYSGNVVGDKRSNYLEAGNEEATVDFFKGKGVKYGGTTYEVGETFRCFSQKDQEVNGEQRTVKEFVTGNNFIVRPVYDEETRTSGVWKRAPKGGWSNEWSMFLTTTHHHPSRTSTWHHDYYGDVMGFLNNRCHILSEDFKLKMYSHLLETFAYGVKPVIRSEAPPGYMYLEGSNADQSWFHSEVDSKKLNEWFYSSCQIYKPDYKVDAVMHKDSSEMDPSFYETDGGEMFPIEGGICRNCGDREEEECAKLNVVQCEEAGGTWVELRDRVIVRLDRRLTHTPNSAFNKHAASEDKMSKISNAGLGKLHHAMGSGPFTAEVYRTDENSIVEYLIREKYKTEEDRPDFETADGKKISGEPLQMQCNKAKIGDSAPDIFIWQLPDDPFGACEPRFYFTKRIPYAYDDNQDEGTSWIKTPVTVDPFIQMEMYLRGFCGGFIDKEADPQHDEINEVEDKYGNMKSLDPTCYKSKDYDYLFENLSIQALDEEGPDDENYKTVFVDHRNADINKDRAIVIERRVPMPKQKVKGQVQELGMKGWLIYRYDTDSTLRLQLSGRGDDGLGIVPVTKAGTVKFKAGSYAEEFIDRYEEILSGRETLGSEKTYYIVAVGKNMNQPLRLNGEILVQVVKTGQGEMTVLKDSQSRAEITFTPSFCSDPEFETKEECEVDGDVWMPVKYYTIERKRTLLPHYTEWKWYETAIDPVIEEYRQAQENKKRSPLRRLPKGLFQISDINLRTGEEEDPIYRGVSKAYEIEVMAYCKREGSGACSDTQYNTKAKCEKAKEVWTSLATSTSNEYDSFDQTIKLRVKIAGSKNPFVVAPSLESGRTPYIVDEADGVFTIRFRDVSFAAIVPKDPSTKKALSGLVKYEDGPFKGSVKLFYDLRYRVKYSYELDDINKTAKRRSEWEVIKKYKELENKKVKVFVDVEEYENQNVNYRVMKAQNRIGGVRWISPLMVVDKLTGYPDDRKGFGPLPNIKLRAYVFNQFANAINLLNEARLDLPIAIKYRYHILSVAKPNAVAPQEGLRAFGYELNEPAPTSGSYCVREYCRHAVTVGNSFDRYEQFTPSWVGHSVIGKWTDPEGESGTSEWYTSYGHTEFQADREYGYRRWPLMESEVDASVAIGGVRADTELKVDGEQLSFRYAVPDILKPRTSSDSLVLSGRMDRDNTWHPTMRSAPKSYWATRDAGVPQYSCSCSITSETIDESVVVAITDPERCESFGGVWDCKENWPAYCGYSDSTGFYSRPFSADGFWGMAQRQEGSDRAIDKMFADPTEPEEGGASGLGAWVIFDREDTSKSWCEDIKGTYMLKAPKLHTSYGGLIVGHQLSGARHMNVCTFGGSQSRLVFTTRASTGDSNMRMKIPVKDKIGSWPHWSSVAEQHSGHISDTSNEDKDTSKPEDDSP